MRKTFLMKIISLVLLAGLLITAIATMNNKSNAASGSGETQTFFHQFVLAGGPIVWFILLPMSLITVYLLAEYFFTINRKKLLPADSSAVILDITQNFAPAQLQAKLADRDDLVSTALKRAITYGRGDWYRMQSSLFESLEEQTLHLLRKIEWVNLIGNVSPMVGLFGTVFGMIQLFNAIVIAGGQPQPAKLAGGISVALVTTFWGLLIAIPALAIHGIFRNRIETLVSEATAEAEKTLSSVRMVMEKQKIITQAKLRQSIQEIPSPKSANPARSATNI